MNQKYDDEILIQELLRFIREHNRVPKYSDMSNKHGYPSHRAYTEHFGSWNNALIIAGIKPFNYNKEILINELLRFVNENNRNPIVKEMCKKNNYPSEFAFKTHFGSWNAALIAAGLEVNNYHYIGTEKCSRCMSNKSTPHWYHNDNNLICNNCFIRNLYKNDPIKFIKHNAKHKGYGFNPINCYFIYSHAHHLWIENTSDWVIFLPEFLHRLHQHSHSNIESMITPNILAIDFWINEEFYKHLFELK
jgi:hypothetical protein